MSDDSDFANISSGETIYIVAPDTEHYLGINPDTKNFVLSESATDGLDWFVVRVKGQVKVGYTYDDVKYYLTASGEDPPHLGMPREGEEHAALFDVKKTKLPGNLPGRRLPGRGPGPVTYTQVAFLIGAYALTRIVPPSDPYVKMAKHDAFDVNQNWLIFYRASD